MPQPAPTPSQTSSLPPVIGGVDEAGRGPLAGPVVAAVVVLRSGQKIAGVRDSKLLTPRRRAELAVAIRAAAVDWAVGYCSPAEIDRLNILNATLLAMQRAIAGLRQLPVRLRIDGNRAPRLARFEGELETVVGGDRSCVAVGAASILAKVSRDATMVELDARYPGYGFAIHKGYATAAHREALARLGPCDIHRRSFRPVRLAEAVSP